MDTLWSRLNLLGELWARELAVVLVQSTVLALVVLLITRLCRPRAAVCYWLWMLVPLRLMVMPLLTLSLPVLPAASIPAAAPTPAAGPAPVAEVSAALLSPSPTGASAPASGHTPAAAGQPLPVAAAPGSPSLWAVLLCGWVAGVALGSLRLLRHGLRAHALRRRARDAVDPAVLQAAAGAARAIRMKRFVRLLLTEETTPPFASGVLRPAIVVPRTLARHLPEEQLRAVLVHELAHLRRRDPLGGWLVALCQVLYFFHPILHLARHYILLERERACDEIALARGGVGAATYANALIAAVSDRLPTRGRAAPLVAAAESFWHLRQRLEALGEARKPRAELSRASLAVLGALTLLAIPGVTLTPGCVSTEDRTGDSKGVETPHTFAVRVVDGAGAPVTGAGVEVLSNYRPVASARTGEGGQATLAVAKDLPVQWVVALKSGAGLDYFSNLHSAPGWPRTAADLPEQIDLVLDGARTVAIRAVDRRNAPVSEVRFAPWILSRPDREVFVNLSGSRLASAVSDPSGRAVFDWIPVVAQPRPVTGTTFAVQSPEYHWPDPPPDALLGEEDLEITARLLARGTLRGRVVFPEGRPAQNLLVQAEGRGATSGLCRTEIRTDSSGAFELAVCPGFTYVVAVVDPEWTARKTGIEVGDGQVPEPVELVLEEGALLHGRLQRETAEPVAGELVVLAHETTPSAEPLPAGAMFMEYDRIGFVQRTLTDAQGRYAFRVPAGSYRLAAMGGSSQASHNPPLVRIESGQEIRRDFAVTSELHYGVTGALVKANHPQNFDHFLAFVRDSPSEQQVCMICHSR